MKKNRKQGNLIFFGWLGSIVFLFFYSFTQVDLGLTLTRASVWQPIQKAFQHIGYFNRPLSTLFYLAILSLLYSFYLIIIRLIKKNQISQKQIFWLIILTGSILWFSYNAFSYDLFNYLFDAKIVTFYHQNPYRHKALDYLGDPMLGFMHWTHRLYPYGPIWLAVTILLSFLGFQKLAFTLISFKGLTVLSYLICSYFIYRILRKVDPKNSLKGVAIFAFSPLVIVESLISAHNDILMMALTIVGFWYLLEKKAVLGWLMLILSIGIKFATAFLVPVFLWVSFCYWKGKSLDWKAVFRIAFVLMSAAVFMAAERTEIQPWYLLMVLPLVGLLPGSRIIFGLMTIFSAGLLLSYAPFLYLGNWNPPVPTIKLWLTIIFLALGIVIGWFGRHQQVNEKNLA